MSEKNNKLSKSTLVMLAKVFSIIMLVLTIWIFVLLTGGTKTAYVQFMYFPIILAAIFWGSTGGLAVGLISGFLVGPLMPLNVSEGIMQDPVNWITRIFIYTSIGFFTGYILNRVTLLNNKAQEKNLTSPFYPLPNTSKLLLDIQQSINKSEHFKIYTIKLTNLMDIERFIDANYALELVENLAKEFDPGCGREAVYSSVKDELSVLVFTDCINNYEETVMKILNQHSIYPVLINGYSVRVGLKIGVYDYQGNDELPVEIYNKARIANEQGERRETGLYYYSENLEKSRRAIHDLTGSLLESIRNNEMFVMYQPKIDIVNRKISGVEALVRWKKDNESMVGPNIFIPIAEEIGFIKDITRFVFQTATSQMKIWENQNIKIKCAINTSATDFIDSDFIEWIKKVLSNQNIKKSDIEFELTERAIAYDDNILLNTLNNLKKDGYQISIDDFGTGYNSLKAIGNLPYDILKIDKYFIDRIDMIEIRELLKHFIEYAHTLGKIVIAEGVETKEQLNMLQKLNCDKVQGYYFSKPLLPKDFEEFYLNFEKSDLFNQ